MRLCVLTGFLCLHSIFATAQLCTGTKGDPIVNVTFGVGHAPLPPNTTTYEYARGCPAKGQYTISNFLFGCGGNWVQMTGDHTLNYNGNYMMVNAENTPGIVHLDTASGLCPNITYEYAAFITNVMQSPLTCGGHAVLPNLTFRIEKLDGTLLASYNTGDIPITNVKSWKQYGTTFNNPAGNDAVVLKLVANAAPGCGNGFALDDITFRQCSPVAVNLTIDGSTDAANVCADYTNPFIMKGTFSAGLTDPVIVWQNSLDSGLTWNDIPGENTNTYQVPHRYSGTILYRMEVADRGNINSLTCRVPSNVIYTEIHPVPQHIAPQNILGCLSQDFVLPPSDPKALSIRWTLSNGDTSNDPALVIQNLKPRDTGLYTLQENFYFGCVRLDTFYLSAFPGIRISVDTAHSLCQGNSEILSATSSVPGTFKWIPAAGLSNDAIGNPVATPQQFTNYQVIVTNSYGCKDSAYVPISVYKNPVAQAGPDKIILSGDTATLNASVRGTNVNYYWSPSLFMNDSHSLNPYVYPPQEMNYTLNVVSTVGCGTATDDVKISVYKDIFIPNAFTPNGDGINDVFRIIPYENYKVNRFCIYDRWGKLMFETTDAHNGWDGTINGIPAAAGVYIYYVEMQNRQKKISKKGTIILLR
ncbi:MAG: gliding motility-associated C-terminal domain-containing protein [Bacteroidota bacterium]|nr:gliding motility-associated C-terminal domain-containing protein [Bacteroidota bacterium]